MALTKVRPPVTEISELANGTTIIDIPTSASDIDVDVAGLDVIDLGQTTITVDDLVTMTVKNVIGEILTLATSGGAAGILQTDANKLEIGTTSTDPVEIISDNVARLTVQAGGPVTLGSQGVADTDLINKLYVDTSASSLTVLLADMISANTTTGSIVIPNSTGNDLIINWGQTASIASTSEVVTFDTEFPNAIFVGFATRNIVTQGDNACHAGNYSLTQMTISQTGSGASTVAWLAIGF